jgi:plasmid stability protein
MPVTLTIKQVPERLARRLRERAAAHHRSIQGELMALLEAALEAAGSAAQPRAAYRARRPDPAKAASALPTDRAITLAELWEMGRKQGLRSPSASTRILRKARDERHRG